MGRSTKQEKQKDVRQGFRDQSDQMPRESRQEEFWEISFPGENSNAQLL